MRSTLLPIQAVARKPELPDQYFERIGVHGSKVKMELLEDASLNRRGKLVLVTTITHTLCGKGKTGTAIGLARGSRP